MPRPIHRASFGIPVRALHLGFALIVLCVLAVPTKVDGQACCVIPTLEDSEDVGANFMTMEEQFNQTLSDAAGDSFDVHSVQELTTKPGLNTCFWAGSGLPENPGVSGGSWVVGTVAGRLNTTTGAMTLSGGTAPQ